MRLYTRACVCECVCVGTCADKILNIPICRSLFPARNEPIALQSISMSVDIDLNVRQTSCSLT